jgi:hypothetical protein
MYRLSKNLLLLVIFEIVKRQPFDGKIADDVLADGKRALLAVEGGRWCTVTDNSRFFSFRRDGVTGR